MWEKNFWETRNTKRKTKDGQMHECTFFTVCRTLRGLADMAREGCASKKNTHHRRAVSLQGCELLELWAVRAVGCQGCGLPELWGANAQPGAGAGCWALWTKLGKFNCPKFFVKRFKIFWKKCNEKICCRKMFS